MMLLRIEYLEVGVGFVCLWCRKSRRYRIVYGGRPFSLYVIGHLWVRVLLGSSRKGLFVGLLVGMQWMLCLVVNCGSV